MVVNNWPRLYVESLADVTDVAEAIGKEQGGYYDLAKVIDNIDGKWIGVPWAIGGGLVAYRKSWFEEIGYKDGKFPGTWDEPHDAASTSVDARKKPATYQTANRPQLSPATLHAPTPKGPAHQYPLPAPFTAMLMKYSPNEKPATDDLKWVHPKPMLYQWIPSQ